VQPAPKPRDPRWFAIAFSTVLLAVIFFAGRLRTEHVLLLPVFGALPWIGPRATKLWATLTPFVMVGILYDLFVLLLPYRAAVHVGDLYGWEQHLFSVSAFGKTWILPELFQVWTNPVLDFACGLAYATYLFEMVAAGIFLHFRARPLALVLGFGFLSLNIVGILCWLAFPAAPPWYVASHGFGPAKLDTIASAAGAARFDALLGVGYFKSFYSRNVNVFGAMPSLHVACATLVALTVGRHKTKALTGAAIVFASLVAFGAIYLGHHYVLDVIAGALLALVVFAVLSRVMPRWEPPRGTP
jgi:membrane-associated phospholipid phosphatase